MIRRPGLTSQNWKRSVAIGRHKTSISLEAAFWTSLKEIAPSKRSPSPRLSTVSIRIASTRTCPRSSGSTCWTIIAGSLRPRGRRQALIMHKFHFGQTVEYRARYASWGAYVVTAKLPERDDEYEYRIRNLAEAHERMARESDLIAIAPDNKAAPGGGKGKRS